MYAGAYISAQKIGSLKEVTLEFVPNLVGRILRLKGVALTYRSNGEIWFTHPAGEQVEPKMVASLEKMWSEFGPKPNPTN